MSQFFKITEFESGFRTFLQQINDRFMKEDNSQQKSTLISELKPIFMQHFLDNETKENDIIEIIKMTKNLKDFLHKKLSLIE